MQPRRVLITTTIRVPHNLRDWRRVGFDDRDVFIVAGDLKTPDQEVVEFLRTLPGDNRYLNCPEQEKWESSKVIGWNSVQRRNIALLEAIALRPEYIITVDDDNYPIAGDHIGHLDAIFAGLNREYYTVSSASGWANVCASLEPPCVHRGYPISQRLQEPHELHYDTAQSVGVVASLWLGDPDIDAVQRMTAPYHITGLSTPSMVLERDTWCPFNSQATAYLHDLAPLMACWPGVGRYDDIWASYLARAVMDLGEFRVLYGHPCVRQVRNQHDIIADLKNELLGLEHTEALCDILRRNTSLDLHEVFATLEDAKFIPTQTKNFFNTWLHDVATAQRMWMQPV